MDAIATFAVDPVLRGVCVATLAALMLVTGWAKLRHFGAFTEAVRGYALVPEALVPAVAGCVAVLEPLAAVALLAPPWRTAGAWAAVLLCAMAAAALTVNLARGRTELHCGCTGFAGLRDGESARIGIAHLVRAAGLLGLAVVALLPDTGRPTNWLDILAGSAATLVALIALWAVDGLLLNAPKLDSLRT